MPADFAQDPLQRRSAGRHVGYLETGSGRYRVWFLRRQTGGSGRPRGPDPGLVYGVRKPKKVPELIEGRCVCELPRLSSMIGCFGKPPSGADRLLTRLLFGIVLGMEPMGITEAIRSILREAHG